MKLINKKILVISKLVLLFNYALAGEGNFISEDRLLFKISDKVISQEDIGYFDRNIKTLKCLYPDSLTYRYFGEEFVETLSRFQNTDFPSEVKKDLIFKKKLVSLFKLLKYSDSQRLGLSKDLVSLVKESIRVNRCKTDVLFKGELRANFKSLLSLELYLKSRYATSLKGQDSQGDLRQSMDILIESIDKQYQHEFYF